MDGPGVDDWLLEHPVSANTEDRYRRALRMIQDDGLDLATMTARQFLDWLNLREWASSTRWVNFTAVRLFLRWKYGDDHPALKLRIKRQESPPQRVLDQDQIMALLVSFDRDQVKGRRDLAICSLMLDSGLRCAEVCRLERRYLDLDKRRLTVVVKGGEWRAGGFGVYTALYLREWLELRKVYAGDRVFVSVGGLTRGQPLTRSGLQQIVEEWGERLGIAMSPHDFRRTFAVTSYRNGAPDKALLAAGRWKSVKVMHRYLEAIGLDDFEGFYPVTRTMGR